MQTQKLKDFHFPLQHTQNVSFFLFLFFWKGKQKNQINIFLKNNQLLNIFKVFVKEIILSLFHGLKVKAQHDIIWSKDSMKHFLKPSIWQMCSPFSLRTFLLQPHLISQFILEMIMDLIWAREQLEIFQLIVLFFSTYFFSLITFAKEQKLITSIISYSLSHCNWRSCPLVPNYDWANSLFAFFFFSSLFLFF